MNSSHITSWNAWKPKTKKMKNAELQNANAIISIQTGATLWLFVAVFSEATHEGFGLCSVLNVDMINLQPTFMMFTNGLI